MPLCLRPFLQVGVEEGNLGGCEDVRGGKRRVLQSRIPPDMKEERVLCV